MVLPTSLAYNAHCSFDLSPLGLSGRRSLIVYGFRSKVNLWPYLEESITRYEKQNLETFELYGLITSVNLTNPILYGPGIPSGSHNPCKGQPKIGRKRILVTLCKETWKYCWKVNYFKSLKNWTPILQLSSQNQIKLSKRGWGYLLPIDTFKKPQQSPLEVHQDDEGPKKGPQGENIWISRPKDTRLDLPSNECKLPTNYKC